MIEDGAWVIRGVEYTEPFDLGDISPRTISEIRRIDSEDLGAKLELAQLSAREVISRNDVTCWREMVNNHDADLQTVIDRFLETQALVDDGENDDFDLRDDDEVDDDWVLMDEDETTTSITDGDRFTDSFTNETETATVIDEDPREVQEQYEADPEAARSNAENDPSASDEAPHESETTTERTSQPSIPKVADRMAPEETPGTERFHETVFRSTLS